MSSELFGIASLNYCFFEEASAALFPLARTGLAVEEGVDRMLSEKESVDSSCIIECSIDFNITSSVLMK